MFKCNTKNKKAICVFSFGGKFVFPAIYNIFSIDIILYHIVSYHLLSNKSITCCLKAYIPLIENDR